MKDLEYKLAIFKNLKEDLDKANREVCDEIIKLTKQGVDVKIYQDYSVEYFNCTPYEINLGQLPIYYKYEIQIHDKNTFQVRADKETDGKVRFREGMSQNSPFEC